MRFVIALLALLSASLAAAEETIVVTAVPRDPVELKRKVDRFVTRLRYVTVGGQYARRNDDVCPAVYGLDARYVGLITAKIAEAATLAGRRILPLGCTADLAIIFTDHGEALAKAFGKRASRLFSNQTPAALDAFFGPARPVRWIAGIGSSGKDGEELIEGSDNLEVNKVFGGGSLIGTSLAVNITGSFVIVDVKQTEGYPLNAIASYIAMVSFAEVSPRFAKTLVDVPTVLGMFERAAPRAAALTELTAWDRAYLRALYSVPPNREGWQQALFIEGRMRRELAE